VVDSVRFADDNVTNRSLNSAGSVDFLDAVPETSCRAGCCFVEPNHFLLHSIRRRSADY